MKYRVEGYQNAERVENGSDAETTCDTLKEAKEKAIYWMTAAYARASESSEPCQRVKIFKEGFDKDECVFDEAR